MEDNELSSVIYGRTITISFRLAVVLLTINSGAIVGLLNFIAKILRHTVLVRCIATSLIFFILAILLSLTALIKLKNMEELKLRDYENQRSKNMINMHHQITDYSKEDIECAKEVTEKTHSDITSQRDAAIKEFQCCIRLAMISFSVGSIIPVIGIFILQ